MRAPPSSSAPRSASPTAWVALVAIWPTPGSWRHVQQHDAAILKNSSTTWMRCCLLT
jgi:hypothetical protein